MILDANVLLYAVDEGSPHHPKAKEWLDAAIADGRRIALPWQTIGAFVRIATHPRVFRQPLAPADASGIVQHWLAAPNVWIPAAGPETVRILGELIGRHGLTGNLITDAQLAALAVEHGVPVVSADADFARIPEVRWVNPIAAQS